MSAAPREARSFSSSCHSGDRVRTLSNSLDKQGLNQGNGMKTVILLTISNLFMTIAWYGHLKYTEKPIVWVILISWAVALFEYIFQVPANRIGAQTFSVTQLKIMQECITLLVFTVVAYFLFGQTLKWNNLVSYALIVGAVYFSFAF